MTSNVMVLQLGKNNLGNIWVVSLNIYPSFFKSRYSIWICDGEIKRNRVKLLFYCLSTLVMEEEDE